MVQPYKMVHTELQIISASGSGYLEILPSGNVNIEISTLLFMQVSMVMNKQINRVNLIHGTFILFLFIKNVFAIINNY